MIIHHKNRYRRALSDSQKTNRMLSGSGSSSQSTALNPDLGSIPVENSTGSHPSSHSSLKLSLKIPPPDKINTTIVEGTAHAKTNTNSSATSRQTVELPTPMSASPQSSILNTPNNALKLSGVQSTSATPQDRENTPLGASYSTQDASLLSPPDSNSTTPASSSSSSLSSVQSEHSSYSVTHKSLPSNNELNGALSRARKGNSVASQIETRASSNSFRPVGPAHLEHDYAKAREELSNAVAISAYELFGFSIPVRNAEMESKRPGKDQIPQLRDHPLVQKAAQALDKADEELEVALARGETFENTPIPDQWRWGSDLLRPYEWARPEPEVQEEPPRRRIRSRAEVVQPVEPRTRAQKKGKSDEVSAEEQADVEPSSVQANIGFEAQSLPDCVPSSASDNIQTLSHTSRSTTQPLAEDPATLPGSSSIPTVPLTSSTVASTVVELSQGEAKRKCGRPRKSLPEPITIQTQITPAASTPSPFRIKIRAPMPSSSRVSTAQASETTPPPTTGTTGTESLAATTAPLKRKRGRPRKYPVPITEQQEGLSPVVERKTKERPSKRRKVGSSESSRA
ncbi:uncharacterized protein FOMMEDRAFT_30963 [Fomitiporia mediterranea MF3/22]|uniref:uncharacterized protein n=1 Tax=Fomitiporia mediterranea (strain MF3/22) TaxID=694068 RepID=UPI0004409085|nr:uncharacterized protein FOMMEDRAFT_30963 [Fomitiporia mediterranea MF3/22]EJC99649.1 hypothetical protein FOMMEDRAFT_30963 [Fomitiporia mediterranea MF3/22]